MPSSTGEPDGVLLPTYRPKPMPMPMPMNSLFARIIHPFVVAIALGGCTASTQSNFMDPPSGPPSTCAMVDAVAGCIAGSVSYACTAGRPDDGDADIVCNGGVAGVGSTLYCCAPYAQWATSCTPSTTVEGCGESSIGFSCTGGASPDQADDSLVCSAAVPGNGGAQDYCCVSFDPSSGVCRCASFDDSSGTCGGGAATPDCAAGAIAFSCDGTHDPTEVNPLLVCPAADGGNAGSFCCSTP